MFPQLYQVNASNKQNLISENDILYITSSALCSQQWLFLGKIWNVLIVAVSIVHLFKSFILSKYIYSSYVAYVSA